MTAAYFEEHPTDPDKVIMRKPPHDVDLFWRAVTTPEKWVGLTDEEINEWTPEIHGAIRAIEAKLKEKNCG
jgi:hypothetical protein